MKAEGKAYKYGDNIDTDIIIPARYLNMTDPKELAKYCMEPLDPGFYSTVAEGDIMVAKKNFGCGSSREHAPMVIKECGVGCVIATTYARIFYRNAVNIGLPIVECEEAAEKIQAGDQVAVDFSAGEIKNMTRNETYHFSAFPSFMQEIMAAGGLVNQAREKLNK